MIGGREDKRHPIAFDLLEVNGEDIRQEPIEDRKHRLAGLLRLPHSGIALNETYREDGAIIFKHACALGLMCEAFKRIRGILQTETLRYSFLGWSRARHSIFHNSAVVMKVRVPGKQPS